MRLERYALAGIAAALCGCSPSQSQRSRPASRNSPEPTQASQFQVIETPPPPPISAIDPKSSEAAQQLVRGLVYLLNRRRFDEAYMLLGPGAPPRSDFDRQFAALSGLSVTMGAPGDQEGAAGSIYLSVPVQVSGRLNGDKTDRSMTVILRRVNDVPGSTDAQRHWHIDRIDPQSA
jgi:hypothetical protein